MCLSNQPRLATGGALATPGTQKFGKPKTHRCHPHGGGGVAGPPLTYPPTQPLVRCTRHEHWTGFEADNAFWNIYNAFDACPRNSVPRTEKVGSQLAKSQTYRALPIHKHIDQRPRRCARGG